MGKKLSIHTTTQKDAVRVLWGAAETALKQGAALSFFKNIMTPHEQQVYARRLVIGRMLLSGLPHREIRLRLQVSPNTVTTVNKWLMGQIPEYGEVIKNMKRATRIKHIDRHIARQKALPWYRRESVLPFVRLRRRYPLHFLLFNIADELLINYRHKKAKR